MHSYLSLLTLCEQRMLTNANQCDANAKTTAAASAYLRPLFKKLFKLRFNGVIALPCIT